MARLAQQDGDPDKDLCVELATAATVSKIFWNLKFSRLFFFYILLCSDLITTDLQIWHEVHIFSLKHNKLLVK